MLIVSGPWQCHSALCARGSTTHPSLWLTVLFQKADRQSSLMDNLFGNDTPVENLWNLMWRWCILEASRQRLWIFEFVRTVTEKEGGIMCLHYTVRSPPTLGLSPPTRFFSSDYSLRMRSAPCHWCIVSCLRDPLLWQFVSQEWGLSGFWSLRILSKILDMQSHTDEWKSPVMTSVWKNTYSCGWQQVMQSRGKSPSSSMRVSIWLHFCSKRVTLIRAWSRQPVAVIVKCSVR